LELALCAVLPRADVKPLAKRLLSRFGSVSAMLAAPVAALAKVYGIGEVTAVYLSGIQALMVRSARERAQAQMVLSSCSALLAYVKLNL
jgi:DNA repair protein RadC